MLSCYGQILTAARAGCQACSLQSSVAENLTDREASAAAAAHDLNRIVLEWLTPRGGRDDARGWRQIRRLRAAVSPANRFSSKPAIVSGYRECRRHGLNLISGSVRRRRPAFRQRTAPSVRTPRSARRCGANGRRCARRACREDSTSSRWLANRSSFTSGKAHLRAFGAMVGRLHGNQERRLMARSPHRAEHRRLRPFDRVAALRRSSPAA